MPLCSSFSIWPSEILCLYVSRSSPVVRGGGRVERGRVHLHDQSLVLLLTLAGVFVVLKMMGFFNELAHIARIKNPGSKRLHLSFIY
jgi:hypothetical protein